MKPHFAARAILASPSLFSAAVILAFAGITGFRDGACGGQGAEISGAARLLGYLGFPVLVAHWLTKQSNNGPVWRVWDLGLFLLVAWPLAIPYYLLNSRRARGLLPIAAFVGSRFAGVALGSLLFKK